jgi:hypothetical protein
LGGWCPIEEDLHLSAFVPAEFLKDGNQFHFIVEGIQA